MLPSLMILYDFLADPQLARERALALVASPAPKLGNYPGQLSAQPLPINGLEEQISERIGVPLQPAPGTSHGHCRLTLRGDKGKSGVHIDPCFYSGILYLSRDEHARGGTDFFRHRPTGMDRVPPDLLGAISAGFADLDTLVEQVINRDTLRPSAWERVMRVPMRFNRLILFSPWLFHNAGEGFGDQPGNGRLVHLQFFARA